MSKCIFCRIVNKPDKEAYRIVSSNDKFICMLVSHPETEGHMIVFPKKHYSEILEMPNYKEICGFLVSIAEALVPKLGTNAYTLKMNNRVYLLDKSSLHVGHLHIHIIPRYPSDKRETGNPIKVEKKLLERLKLVLAS